MTRLKDKFDDTAREKRRFVKCNDKSKRSKQAGGGRRGGLWMGTR